MIMVMKIINHTKHDHVMETERGGFACMSAGHLHMLGVIHLLIV